MKVNRGITIDGVVVEQIGSIAGSIEVYSNGCGEDQVTLYFLNKNDEVMTTIDIETDMGQGQGFVSDIKVEKLL